MMRRCVRIVLIVIVVLLLILLIAPFGCRTDW
jgi:hypothetical protein